MKQRINVGLIFVLIVFAYLLLYLITREADYQILSHQITHRSIHAFLDTQSHSHYQWLEYIFIPVIVGMRVIFAVVCIGIASILANVNFSIRKITRAVTIAEIVFLLAQAGHLASIFLYSENHTVDTAASYFLLSFISLWGAGQIAEWLQYPLQTLNLFEIAYMVFIGWLLSRDWERSFLKSLVIVVPSYGLGLLLWLVLIAFLTLQGS